MSKATSKHPCEQDQTAPNDKCVVDPKQPVKPHREENIETAKNQRIPNVERKSPPKPEPHEAD